MRLSASPPEIDDPWQRVFVRARPLTLGFAKHPVIGAINVLAADLIVILGPMFWAALIDSWLYALFFAN